MSNQSLHGSGPRVLFLFVDTFSSAPWTWCYTAHLLLLFVSEWCSLWHRFAVRNS
jgi:hypothetical protein